MIKRFLDFIRDKYQSLIFRILLYFVISIIAVALVLGWNFANRIKPRFEKEVLPNLAQYIQYIVADIGVPPDLIKAKALTEKLPFELRIKGPDVNWTSINDLGEVSQYYFKAAPYPYQDYHISHRHQDHLLYVERDGFQFLFAVDSSFRSGSRDRHRFLFVLLGGILFVLYLAIRRLFRPLGDISNHLKHIGSGQLDDSLDIKGTGEIAQLGRGINQMTLEIKSMLESKAGLLLAISHELRSPITRMRVNLELVDNESIRATLIQDIQEMEELVSSILESERLNTRHAVLNRSEFDFAEVVKSVIKRYFDDCHIEAHLSSVTVNMDNTRIRLLLKNLIDNACRHSAHVELPVTVSIKTQAETFTLSVIDHGPGVSAIDLQHITEPFYRTDTSRLRKTGGYGLGLYLCKLIVEAHRGKLNIQSQPEQGLCVIAEFPREI